MPPVPSREDLVRLFVDAVSNARALLADAECLMGTGSFPRACALATFAAEELGKGNLCMVVLSVPGDVSIDRKAFWREFYSHEGKLLRELSVQGLLLEGDVSSVLDAVGLLPGVSAAAHRRKVRGLYVGYEHGAILRPGDITQQEARQVIDDVRRSLAVLDAVLEPEDALDQLRAITGDGQAEFFRQAVRLLAPDVDTDGWDAGRLYAELIQRIAADPEGSFRVWHELWREFRPSGEESA
jgi:AbiV family abortive infection protein